MLHRYTLESVSNVLVPYVITHKNKGSLLNTEEATKKNVM